MVSSSASRRVRFDRFELDLDSGELWREGVSVDLPPQPSRILAILVEGAGTLVGRVELRQRIWGEDWLDWEASLHQAIRRIRVALGDSATEPRFIETMPRRGYRFVAQVEAVGPVQRAAPIERRHPRARSVSRRSWLSFSAAGTIALVAVLSVVFLATLPTLVRETPAEATAAASPALGTNAIPPEARRLQSEGQHLLGRGAVPAALERFREAAELAPEWAAPWSAIGEAELAYPAGQGVGRARIAIERALVRDPKDARSWRLLGRLRLWEEWDWLGARRALDHAALVGPDNAEVWQLVAALETVLGRETPALEAAHRAMALDPISTARQVDLGWTYYYFDRGEEALAECRRSLELEPESPWGRQCVLQALLLLGRSQEASALLAGIPGVPEAEPVQAYFHRQLDLLTDVENCSSGAAAAAIPRIVLGDREGALDALVAGAHEGRGWEVPFARVDPLLAPLREDPRYELVELSLGTSLVNTDA